MIRVKLVEKGLPVSEEDQIRSQSNLKRSLELTARSEEESCKKIKTEDVIDAEIQLQVDKGGNKERIVEETEEMGGGELE